MAASAQTSPLKASQIGKSPAQRLQCVDALRGFDMFWILGGDYVVRSFVAIHDSPLTRWLAGEMEHSEWAGFHFYDFIFPLFIFIVGVSLVFSLSGMLERVGRAATLKRIFRRSIILFLLGVFHMGGVANGFDGMCFAGVLQRIAGAYFFAALIFCFFRPRQMVWICAALLAGYWALLTFVPVPGMAAPTLAAPGKNLAHFIDEQYLPGQRFEGTILSTMTAVANCLLGVFAGLLLRNDRVKGREKVMWLAAGGGVSLLLGLVWSLEFPIIKLLWTSSYVLVAGGCSALLLALFYQLIEQWNFRSWAQPFVWIGLNALPIYVIAGIVNFHRLTERFAGGDVRNILGHWSGLATAVLSLALALWLARFFYRQNIFLRL